MTASPWVLPVLRRFQSGWTLPPVADLPGPHAEAESATEHEQVEFYWVGTEARLAGTVVHRWLHAFAEERARAELRALPGYRPVTRRWLMEMGVGKGTANAISKRVELALQRILEDEKGRWVIQGEGQAELALTGLFEGELESVILDRVRVDDDGSHWIIDYKTSSHEGGNLPGFLRAEAERYAPQLTKYKAIYAAYANSPVRCALYFPLLQTFQEVNV